VRPLSAIRRSIIAEARKLVDVRFWWHGRTPQGLDCYGLLFAAGRAAGLEVPDLAEYSSESVGVAARGRALAWFEPLNAIGAAIPGDAVEFRVRRRPQHYGILVAEDRMVHASLPARRVCESRLGPDEWKDAVAAYRFAGVGDG